MVEIKTGIKLVNPDSSIWENPTEWLYGYHEGAKACMRSHSIGGSAQQCCYDDKGKLITHGAGAGSADKIAVDPQMMPLHIFFGTGHIGADVYPADAALKLDGGVFGYYSELYLKARSSKSDGCSSNP